MWDSTCPIVRRWTQAGRFVLRGGFRIRWRGANPKFCKQSNAYKLYIVSPCGTFTGAKKFRETWIRPLKCTHCSWWYESFFQCCQEKFAIERAGWIHKMFILAWHAGHFVNLWAKRMGLFFSMIGVPANSTHIDSGLDHVRCAVRCV